jgi:hypothetical protein
LRKSVKGNENYHKRGNGHNGQNYIHKTAVGNVRHVGNPCGKRRVVGQRTEQSHYAVHDYKHNYRRNNSLRRNVAIAEKSETCRNQPPHDVAETYKLFALADSVGQHAAEN